MRKINETQVIRTRRTEENQRGRRKGEEAGERGQTRGLNELISLLVQVLVRKLYLVKICGELMHFIIAIKDPFLHPVISHPHLVERIASP